VSISTHTTRNSELSSNQAYLSSFLSNPQNTLASNALNNFAQLLADRFSPIVGCTRSWNSTAPDFEVYVTNIDILDNADIVCQCHRQYDEPRPSFCILKPHGEHNAKLNCYHSREHYYEEPFPRQLQYLASPTLRRGYGLGNRQSHRARLCKLEHLVPWSIMGHARVCQQSAPSIFILVSPTDR
jgi:hypothetical protein